MWTKKKKIVTFRLQQQKRKIRPSQIHQSSPWNWLWPLIKSGSETEEYLLVSLLIFVLEKLFLIRRYIWNRIGIKDKTLGMAEFSQVLLPATGHRESLSRTWTLDLCWARRVGSESISHILLSTAMEAWSHPCVNVGINMFGSSDSPLQALCVQELRNSTKLVQLAASWWWLGSYWKRIVNFCLLKYSYSCWLALLLQNAWHSSIFAQFQIRLQVVNNHLIKNQLFWRPHPYCKLGCS